MPEIPRPKPNFPPIKRSGPDTRFFIDYEWWGTSHLDLKTFLSTRMSHVGEMTLNPDMGEVDLVDAKTAEVRRVDGFQYMVQVYFSRLPDDFMSNAPLVDAVFCVLLANGNQPMTATEIGTKVRRAPDVILRTFSSSTIHYGIRPMSEE